MKTQHILSILFMVLVVLQSCSKNETTYDATGSFEAVERTISAMATGKILSFSIEEGDLLQAGQKIGEIDITNLDLQAEQLKSSIQSINKKTTTAEPQIGTLNAQMTNLAVQKEPLLQQIEILQKEINRFEKLVLANAAPRKNLDDLLGQKSILETNIQTIDAQKNIIQAQIDAANKMANTQNRAILSEIDPNKKRLAIIEKQIQDGVIINEFNGTVTAKFAYDGEFTTIGKPLYKISDLSNITLRAYITGDQLPLIQLNQEVTVNTDNGSGGYNTAKGKITWISDKAEFTPKTIQTKNERANLVYAIKVNVPNDGSYKIGMYGEVKF